MGIDLGTTNSAVSYVDTHQTPWHVRVFEIPQLVAPGEIESRPTLPSFHYQPADKELPSAALRLPWSSDEPRYAVGHFARDYGGASAGRMIASAKSWLSHAGVDRMADLLPWHGAADAEKLSPVEASARYLIHIRCAWDYRFPDSPLDRQDVVLTLPASFDEVARELTVAAAHRANLPRVILIEEPQAAFYAWVYKHRDAWQSYVSPGQKILVCDIGGGTSDFTLIRVRQGDDGKVQFHRVAVGEHLILGGDNMDLTLAHHLEQRLSPDGKLEPRQWDALVRQCRQLKEGLLSNNAPDSWTVTLAGSGSRLIGGAKQCEVTRDEVQQLILDGFFPLDGLDQKPRSRQSGFQEFGLPYATDPAVTRNLGAFLTLHRHAGMHTDEVADGHDPARPDIVLFNGGVFAADVLRQQLLSAISTWFVGSAGPSPWQPMVLDGDALHLAVARGAAYYGMVRRGEGVRIAASLARSYYIGFESDVPVAMCLVPGSAEPGQVFDVSDRDFQLLVAEPVEFPLFVSSTRLIDRPGELIPVDREQMRELPPIRTVLRTRSRRETGTVGVHLHGQLTEIGTIDLWCSEVHGDRTWKLQFDVRTATQTDIAGHESEAEAQGVLDEATWNAAAEQLNSTFGEGASQSPQDLIKRLEAALEMPRQQWPTSLLRRIWEALQELDNGRRMSAAHELRWLNLLGYALRPGFGLAVDDWRVLETWRTVQGKLAFGGGASRTESWILWRRIAGGLTRGQQRALAEPLIGAVRAMHRRSGASAKGATHGTFTPQESNELFRLLGALELLETRDKIAVGDLLCDLLPRKKMQAARAAMVWAIGRIGARQPVYGPLNTVVPVDSAEKWLQAILGQQRVESADHFAVMQLARKTEDRYRDLSDRMRNEVLDWLEIMKAPRHLFDLVQQGGSLTEEDQAAAFGESLPKGLRLA
ncbi:MAG: Hsp70 family protein [Planctomycetales bacterium]|nr:Hsp70 family protein [Planctomycetales bacterium]